MKKVCLFLALVLCLTLFAACGKPEQSYTAEDVAGKQYVYEGDGFMGDFTLSLYADGTFQYYEGMLSSYIGFGAWTLNGNVLTIKDGSMGRLRQDGTWEYYNRVNRFRVEEGRLVWLAEGSDNFLYVDVEDGQAFLAGELLPAAENPLFAHTRARFTLEEIRDLVLNQGCSEERLRELLDGMTCEETVDLWGPPDGMTSGLWSHWWELDEKTSLVIFYAGSEGLVDEVYIRPEEK